MQTIQRKFHVKSIVMLTATISACKNIEICQADFSAYPHMTLEWVKQLSTDATQLIKLTGIRANELQRAATANIHIIRDDIIGVALIIKNQIDRGYINEKERKSEILNLLGYRANWEKAVNSNQIALLELALTFSNHADDLQDELVAHRVSAEQIKIMKVFADSMNDANITQEALKNTSPIATADMNASLNSVFDRLMDICSAGKIIYRKDPVKKALFSYRRLTSQQISGSSVKPADTPTETT
jgi:hypothetical protein